MTTRQLVKRIALGIAGFWVVSYGFLMITDGRPIIPIVASPQKDQDNTLAVVAVCQEAVEARLKAPAAAVFPGGDSHRTVERLGDRYSIRSYVDAPNSFGVPLRMRWVCDAFFKDGQFQIYRVTLEGGAQ
jgi:hypothetical protein